MTYKTPPLTPERRRQIRLELGLSQPQMGALLETGAGEVSRIERDPSKSTARPAPARYDQLLRAFASGYRPSGWPPQGRAGLSSTKAEKG